MQVKSINNETVTVQLSFDEVALLIGESAIASTVKRPDPTGGAGLNLVLELRKNICEIGDHVFKNGGAQIFNGIAQAHIANRN